jgi:aryl-alcohol dehydrogenase-like predicted oxidoreductase
MKQIALGNTGTEVGAIGLGCLGMSHSYGQADREQSFATLRTALEEGIQFLDTADAYGQGHNEELIGEFLRGNGRGNALIATKFGQTTARDGSRAVCNTPAYIAQACDASLRRLGVETIDLYFMHRRDPAVPLADSIGAMGRLVESGKARWLGISEVSVPTLREAHAVHPITALESEYSLWTRDVEGPVLDACRELGVTFVAFSPLSRAFLTGTLELEKLDPTDTRTRLPRFKGEAAARNMSVAAQLPAFAAARGVTPAQIALAWLLSRNIGRQTVLPIPGTKRPHYVRENAAAAKIDLSPEEIAELDAMFPVGVAEGARYTPEEEARTGT